MSKTDRFEMRIDPDLKQWLHDTVGKRQASAYVHDLISAAKEGRIRTVPRAGMNPFPSEQVRAGETEEYPVLVCLTPLPPSIQE